MKGGTTNFNWGVGGGGVAWGFACSWRGWGCPSFPDREEEVRKPLEKGGVLTKVARRTNTHVFLQAQDADMSPERAAKEGSAHRSILIVISDHREDLTDIPRTNDDLAVEGYLCETPMHLVGHGGASNGMLYSMGLFSVSIREFRGRSGGERR